MQKTTILVLVFALLALVGCGADDPASSTPLQETAPAVESVLETPEASTPEPESVVENSLESAQSDLEPVDEYIPQYTTTDTSKDALVQLVKDTITINHDRLEEELSNPSEFTEDILGSVVERVRSGNSLDVELLVTHEVEGEQVTFDLFENDEAYAGRTYADWTGPIGEWLFMHNDQSFDSYNFFNVNYLDRFVTYDLFDADVEELDDWNLSGDLNGVAFNKYFEINFHLDFTYGGKVYQALIGNMNDEYIVLDIIQEGDMDLNPVQTTPEPEASQPTQTVTRTETTVTPTPAPQTPSGGDSTSYTPDPTPAPATPAPQPDVPVSMPASATPAPQPDVPVSTPAPATPAPQTPSSGGAPSLDDLTGGLGLDGPDAPFPGVY